MPRLVRQYRAMVEGGANFHGLSIVQHRRQIQKLINQTGAVTLLDYGSGRGDAYEAPHCLHTIWLVPHPTLYDPAFIGIDTLPAGKFDGVLCSDVLEHVPSEEVDAFVRTLFAYATRFVWASVCCRPAKKSFPDGENLHVTVRPFAWWNKKFAHASRGHCPYVLTETP